MEEELPTPEELTEVMENMKAEGLIMDSGMRRPDSQGNMQIVWVLTPLGRAMANVQRDTN